MQPRIEFNECLRDSPRFRYEQMDTQFQIVTKTYIPRLVRQLIPFEY